jgi:DNA-binding CsgD family transcriptional regulator
MADIAVREEKEIDKVGRPCKYESHVQPRLNEVLEWIQAGYTDYSIAETLGVGYSTM